MRLFKIWALSLFAAILSLSGIPFLLLLLLPGPLTDFFVLNTIGLYITLASPLWWPAIVIGGFKVLIGRKTGKGFAKDFLIRAIIAYIVIFFFCLFSGLGIFAIPGSLVYMG